MCDLKKKYKEWKEWLFGDDVHSIRHQIASMIWDTAVFRVINESRKYAQTDEEGNPKLNDMVHGFINHSFFITQALAIRKLLDKETRQGYYSVFSLYRLIDNMEQNSQLLTRENILDVLGYPYNYEEVQKKYYEVMRQKKSLGALANWKYSKIMHKNIDILACVKENNRNPNDTIKRECFHWIKKRLEKCHEIYKYVNKFVAHAATPESRDTIKAHEIKITLGKLFDAHKIMCETAQFVGLNFLNQDLGNFLVILQYDQFEHFEKPWVTESAIHQLRDYWQEYYKETMSWKNWDWQNEFNEHA